MTKLKKILLFLFLLSTSFCYSQKFPIDSVTNLITYTNTVKISSASQYQLFLKANQWFVKTYQQPDVVWQVKDRNLGKLMAKAKMDTKVSYFIGKSDGGPVYYTIQIICKNQRFKYIFSEFYHDGKGTTDGKSGGALENEKTEQNFFAMPLHWDEIRREVDIKIRSLVNDLERFMTTEQQTDQ